MKYSSLSDSELLLSTRRAAELEKSATLDLLEYLAEVDRRRLYSARGYSSLFEYVHKALGYSEAQSSERVSAMRLMIRVPAVRDALLKEKVTLTSVAKIASHVRREKSNSAQTVTLLEKCEGKSTREVERLLVADSTTAIPTPARIRPISPALTRITLEVDQEFMELLGNLKAFHGNAALEPAQLLKVAMKTHVKQRERQRVGKEHASVKTDRTGNHKQRNASRAPEVKRQNRIPSENPSSRESSARVQSADHKKRSYIPVGTRRDLFLRAKNQCEYTDPISKRRCESKNLLEIDHISPHAKGGKTSETNLRVLCHSHNLFHAVREFGAEKMRLYLKNP